eukprot:gnl/TRDRNA2_/TRDRNA2_179840_c0_seq1.p1 gnl/TRDRNA2_/TRDRNA2_179840_c0~~gnl/TRDRNA2_/TRDRNA2_179840_c0_seq1.p1  ORF type:complete len:283 (+),score=47.51 gnl/TRDRNA2_/TRDRNA2_179840_c0_seq1:117-965(+)
MQLLWRVVVALAFGVSHASAQAASPALLQQQASTSMAKPWAKGLLSVKSMKVANTPNTPSKLYFGPDSKFSVGTDAAGNFEVTEATMTVPVIALDASGNLHLNSPTVTASALDVSGGLAVRGVRQWALIHSENFATTAAGWSRPQVSKCAGVQMLGGFCNFGQGETNKTFVGLPLHTQLRIMARFHFIDNWIGESGFMKLNIGQDSFPVTVWSEMHKQEEAKNGISLCGQSTISEGKFAVSIDVTVPHTQDSIAISFGSTTDNSDPCDASWGVSGLEIYGRH